jgi:exodeoxyribonuclease V alpha subunit
MKNEEIELLVSLEKQRWGDTVILSCINERATRFSTTEVTVKTSAEPEELQVGITYRFYGYWTQHPRWGAQFHASSFVLCEPHGSAGIVAYLRRAPGVGAVTAMKLEELWGDRAVEFLREDPTRCVKESKLRGLNEERAERASVFLRRQKGTEDATIDLMGMFAGRGFPQKTAARSIRLWGNRAAKIVRQNAYRLLVLPGCGFARCDQLFLALGGRPDRLKRQTLCIWNGMHRDGSGDTWFSTDFVNQTLSEQLGGCEKRAVKAVKLGLRANLLAVKAIQDTGERWIALQKNAEAEMSTALIVAGMLRRARWPTADNLGGEPNEWPSVAVMGLESLSEHQTEQIDLALMSRIGTFSGSPGTGKTYVAARLISRLINTHGNQRVGIVAPTGKAAVRLTEALSEHGVSSKARTIHSFLGVQQEATGGEWTFKHGPGEPVEQKFIIVDEASMVDTSLMARLLGALPHDGHILFVGDVNQLPPVGHGAPLRDFLRYGVPAGNLTEIRRNAGAIVSTCAKIRHEEPIDFPAKLSSSSNLALHHSPTGEKSQEAIVDLIRSVKASKKTIDPIWDVQVIVAVNEKSPLSRQAMNKLLQSVLNGRARQEDKFWVGDKIVCLSNGLLPAPDDLDNEMTPEDSDGFMVEDDNGQNKIYVANGELGCVVKTASKMIIAKFTSPDRTVLIPRGRDGDVGSFDLGYAISCHKSQGSEWPIVIVALDAYGGARFVCDRSWLYTAISRAKKACLLVGKSSTANDMCLEQKIATRKTFLVEQIAEFVKVDDLEGLAEAV